MQNYNFIIKCDKSTQSTTNQDIREANDSLIKKIQISNIGKVD